jgi:hypothetical protein
MKKTLVNLTPILGYDLLPIIRTMMGFDLSNSLAWRDFVAVLPLTLLCAPKLLAIFALVVVIFFAFLVRPKNQRLLKDVPIVGLENGADIKDLRIKFRHGSKNMLLEGYRKVRLEC